MGGRRSKLIIFTIFVSFIISASVYGAEEKIPKMIPVRLNPHPNSLEGKTLLLRWNGKYNGDKFLSRVGELFVEQVKGIKIVKMWEVDSSTAVISKKMELSDQIASKIAALNPQVVISAQAD
jgi:hypothetical protein